MRQIVSNIIRCTIIIIPLIVLFGWLTNNDVLKSVIPGLVAMNPLSAVLFIICGMILWLYTHELSLLQHFIVKILSVLIILCSGSILWRFFSGFNAHLDTIIFASRLHGNTMAPNTAGAFFLMGILFLFFYRNTKSIRTVLQVLIIFVLLLTTQAVMGYAYNVTSYYQIGSFIPMAIHTAFCFVLLCCGVLIQRKDFELSQFVNIWVVTSSVKKKINLSLIMGLFVLLIIGVITFIDTKALITSSTLVTNKMQEQIYRTQLINLIVNAETGQRGFLLTGNETYLTPYTSAIRDYPIVLAKLHILADDPEDPALLKKIDMLSQSKFNELKLTISLRQSQGFNAAQKVVSTNEGQHIMGQIRTIIEAMDRIDEKDVLIRTVAQDKAGSRTMTTIGFASVIAIIIVFMSILVINTDLKRRRLLEDNIAENELRLTTILENMAEGIIVADKNGKFNYFNPAAEKILGVGMSTQDSTQWQKIYGVYLPDQHTPFPTKELPLIRALNGETTKDIEQFIKNEERQQGLFISVNGTTLRDKNSNIIGAMVVFIDITESKKAKKELEQRINDSEHLNKIMVGRELKMVELKQEIAKLQEETKK